MDNAFDNTKIFPLSSKCGLPNIARLREFDIVAGRLNDIIGPGLVQIEDLRIEVPPDMWVSTGDPQLLLGKRVWLAVVNGQHRLAEMTLRGSLSERH